MSYMENTLSSEIDNELNEQTVLELQNQLSVSRRHQWKNVILKYSQPDIDDSTIDFDTLDIISDESSNDTDESDYEEQVKADVSVVEMSKRWVNICNNMDTTSVCRFCSTLIANSSQCTQFNMTIDKPNVSEKNECKKSESSSSTSVSKMSVPTEKHLIEEYIKESNCELNPNELITLKNTIEKIVGNTLKDLGQRLNTHECTNNEREFDKVKNELVNLLGILVVDVSIKDICAYGEYETWKYDKYNK